MRKAHFTSVALVAAFVLGLAGSALANPPGGTEDTSNNVSCHGTRLGPTRLHVDAHNHGVGVCNDDNGGPLLDGRIIVHPGDGYVAADGDRSNPEPLNGFIRVGSGAGCGNGNQDSTNGGRLDNCG